MNYKYFYWLLFLAAFNSSVAQTLNPEKNNKALSSVAYKKQLQKKEFSIHPIQPQKTANSAVFCRMEETLKRKYNLNFRIRTGGY